MFWKLFGLLVRCIAIPLIFILVIVTRYSVESSVAVLAVNVVYTLLTIPLLIWQLIKVFPNLLLLRVNKSAYLAFEILIGLLSLIGWWVAYALITASN